MRTSLKLLICLACVADGQERCAVDTLNGSWTDAAVSWSGFGCYTDRDVPVNYGCTYTVNDGYLCNGHAAGTGATITCTMIETNVAQWRPSNPACVEVGDTNVCTVPALAVYGTQSVIWIVCEPGMVVADGTTCKFAVREGFTCNGQSGNTEIEISCDGQAQAFPEVTCTPPPAGSNCQTPRLGVAADWFGSGINEDGDEWWCSSPAPYSIPTGASCTFKVRPGYSCYDGRDIYTYSNSTSLMCNSAIWNTTIPVVCESVPLPNYTDCVLPDLKRRNSTTNQGPFVFAGVWKVAEDANPDSCDKYLPVATGVTCHLTPAPGFVCDNYYPDGPGEDFTCLSGTFDKGEPYCKRIPTMPTPSPTKPPSPTNPPTDPPTSPPVNPVPSTPPTPPPSTQPPAPSPNPTPTPKPVPKPTNPPSNTPTESPTKAPSEDEAQMQMYLIIAGSGGGVVLLGFCFCGWQLFKRYGGKTGKKSVNPYENQVDDPWASFDGAAAKRASNAGHSYGSVSLRDEKALKGAVNGEPSQNYGETQASMQDDPRQPLRPKAKTHKSSEPGPEYKSPQKKPAPTPQPRPTPTRTRTPTPKSRPAPAPQPRAASPRRQAEAPPKPSAYDSRRNMRAPDTSRADYLPSHRAEPWPSEQRRPPTSPRRAPASPRRPRPTSPSKRQHQYSHKQFKPQARYLSPRKIPSEGSTGRPASNDGSGKDSNRGKHGKKRKKKKRDRLPSEMYQAGFYG